MAKDLEFSEWIVDRSNFSVPRLMHYHRERTTGFPFRDFCWRDEEDNWFCEHCKEQVPSEVVFVAMLVGTKPIYLPNEARGSTS